MVSKLPIIVFLASNFVVSATAFAQDLTPPAAASKCALTQLASLPINIGNEIISVPTIPVAIGAVPASFAIGLAKPYTAITLEVAKADRIHTEFYEPHQTGFYLNHLTRGTAIVPSLTVGNAIAPNVHAVVLAPSMGFDGILGTDILLRTDIELNLKARKLNMFSQDHCAGQAVYWGRPFTTLPMTFDEQNVPVFQMQLDGKPVTVKLDPTTREATMRRDVAETLFGLTPKTAGVKARNDIVIVSVSAGNLHAPSDEEMREYEFTFNDLSLNGIDVHNLHVLLEGSPPPQACRGMAKRSVMMITPEQCNSGVDLVIGRDELRAMRLYFSFKEKLLYMTAADPDPQPAGSPAH